VVIVQEMDSIATAKKPVVIADFSKYIIRDSQGMRMIRMQERYADYDQVGFVGFMRTDALVLQSAAVKFITMA
jgi:HK97 family phage major capsid protein